MNNGGWSYYDKLTPMANQAQQKPIGQRLPAAKDAAKLMQEGALAMERGQLERAEKRLMAAREQLRQLDSQSWPMFKAGHLVLALRLAQGRRDAALQVAREQLDLLENLPGGDSLEIKQALGDLAAVLESGASGDALDQALARIRSLLQAKLGQDSAAGQCSCRMPAK